MGSFPGSSFRLGHRYTDGKRWATLNSCVSYVKYIFWFNIKRSRFHADYFHSGRAMATCGWITNKCPLRFPERYVQLFHYGDVIMGAIVSQIISLTIVYSTVSSDADQRKHQSSASLAFVWGIHRGPVNSPHKWPVTRKMFPFDDFIMSLNFFPCWICIKSTGENLQNLTWQKNDQNQTKTDRFTAFLELIFEIKKWRYRAFNLFYHYWKTVLSSSTVVHNDILHVLA